MPTSENWLYRRLRNEPVREDERKRWNSVVSRLRRLTEVDESTQQLRDEHVIECAIKTAESELMTPGEHCVACRGIDRQSRGTLDRRIQAA